ncbi:MAG: DNA translocase FtsK, partial [Oscillospiraceae bacterium]|nr:DNA translocase FtsK [Oscillospiraceae bacterium]
MSHKPVDKGRELTGLALLLLAILFAITYYTPASTGLLGRLLLDCGRGLLGVVAYAVPVLFLYMAVDYFISHSKNLTHSRFLHIAILFLLAAALAQAGSLSYRTFTTALQREAGQPLKASAAVRLLWSASQSTADYPSLNGAYPGGVLGGLLTLSLQRLAGHAGALVLLIGAAAAEIILLFNVSLTQAVNQTSVMLRSTGHKLTEAVKQGVETSRQARSARMYEIKAGDEQPPADALAAWPQPEIGSESAAPAAADFSAETAALPDPRPGQPDLPAEAKAQPAAPEQLAQEPPATAASAEKIELVSYKETRKLPHAERSAVDSRHSRFFDIGEDQAGMNVKPSDEEQAYLDQAAQTSLQQDQAAAETGAAFSQIPILSYDPESDSLPLDSPLHASPATQQAAEASADRFVVPDFLQPAPAATSTSQQAASLDDVLDEAMAEPWEADPEVAAVLGQPEARPDQPRSEAVRNPQQPAADPASANPAAAANRYGREIAATAVRAVTAEQAQKGEQLPEAPQRPYRLPPAKLLNPDEAANTAQDRGQITAMGKKLEDTLHSFGVEAKVINITTGPAITRFELTPGVGVKVSRITNLADDIALSLAAVGVRIEAPIPGKSAIGIEIPNKKTTAVLLRPLIESQSFRQAQSRLTVALGRDIPGAPILCDLSKMPHL